MVTEIRSRDAKGEERVSYKVGFAKELSERGRTSLDKQIDKRISKLPDSYETPLSRDVLNDRYVKRTSTGKLLETQKDVYVRVARVLAHADAQYDLSQKQVLDNFVTNYTLMARKLFMPNSPTLMNGGYPNGQLSACFVLPVGDSIAEILDAVKKTGVIHKSGGGTGFNFGRIRPADYFVSTTYGKASGPLSFIGIFNEVTRAVNQGGFRRGANMGILPVHHPNIREFIDSKTNLTSFQNFNFSVGVTDEFIKAYQEDREYELIDPTNSRPVMRLKAREVFDKIVKNAHMYGEPGIILLDRINRGNPTPKLGKIEATNPCGEQPLLSNEACNLGSINLVEFVDRKVKKFDYKRLEEVTELATRFLDNVIDANCFPFQDIADIVGKTRKIGLGVMGFADTAALLGHAYDSPEAVALAERIMSTVQNLSRATSESIGTERGNFPAYEGSIYDKGKRKPMRNAARTTMAPTGSISLICNGVSSGCEPLFSITQERTITGSETKLKYFDKGFELAILDAGLKPEEFWESISKNDGKLEGIVGIPDEIKRVFKRGKDLPVKAHFDIQRAFQRYTDNAVSKTLNFPKGASEQQIREIYEAVFRDPIIKGVTVYVEGSRDDVISSGKAREPRLVWNNIQPPGLLEMKLMMDGMKIAIAAEDNIHIGIAHKLYKHKTSSQYYFYPYEIFQNRLPIGDQESIEFIQTGMERAMMLKSKDTNIVKWLRSMKSVKSSEHGFGEKKCFGLSHGVASALEYVFRRQGIIGDDKNGQMVQLVTLNDLEEVKSKEEAKQLLANWRGGKLDEGKKYDSTANRDVKNKCPDCGETLIHEEGCHGGKCPKCKYDSCL